jgi:predicted Rossmann-fold nucleotide-binding protein
MKGWTPEEDNSVDLQIYNHFVEKGRHRPHVMEALCQRLHDHAIDDALLDLLEGRVDPGGEKKVVAIMGGHGTPRTDPYFRKVVEIARDLTREGYFVASGGGPGIMEASNLGAWIANADDAFLDRALTELAKAPIYSDPSFNEVAAQIRDWHPEGAASLAIPTWFYGHEPSNQFSVHIAKYFSNGLREDGLLAIARYGVIYAPGSAGTTQEIFMDAAQNHYGTFEFVSPMVFLGEDRYGEETGLYETLSRLASGRQYKAMLSLTDDPAEVVSAIKKNQPQPFENKNSVT